MFLSTINEQPPTDKQHAIVISNLWIIVISSSGVALLFCELAADDRLHEALVLAARLLPEFPAELVDATTAGQIRQGKDFRLSPFRQQPGARYVKAVTREGELVAIGEARLPHLYHPILVL